MLISFLMGHALEGVSAKYTNELMIANSASLREAQEHISKRIVSLLGLTLGGVCTENLIRVDSVMESPKLAE